jgi:hypothetical protein
VFCHIAGFPDPLDSPFYPHRRYIDVYLFNRKLMNGGNGRNFSTPFPIRDPDERGARSSYIHILNTLDVTGNPTPAHEFFHQIQNGMTRVTNTWFYEGTARWSEEALHIQHTTARRPDTPRRNSPANAMDYPLSYLPEHPRKGLWDLLEDPAHVARFLSLAYDAALLLWIPLANCSPGDRIVLPGDDPVLKLTYSNGIPVVKRHVFAGARIIRAVLEELGATQDAMYREIG